MTDIFIYVEGGGDTSDQRAVLRQGFDGLFRTQKQAAREKGLRWKLVPSGGRDLTYKAFLNAVQNSSSTTLNILLVDSEDKLDAEIRGQPEENAQVRKRHLEDRDGWDFPDEVKAEQIHLMVQCMEAWIVADPEALSEYYKKGFNRKKLPERENLEDEPKESLLSKFAKATEATSKGEYSEKACAKITHASALLAKIDSKKVARKCPRFATLTDWLNEQIKNA